MKYINHHVQLRSVKINICHRYLLFQCHMPQVVFHLILMPHTTGTFLSYAMLDITLDSISRYPWKITRFICFNFLHSFKQCFEYCSIVWWCLTPLWTIFQLYHGDQFWWWKKPEYPERTTDHGKATGKLYHLRLREPHIHTLVSKYK